MLGLEYGIRLLNISVLLNYAPVSGFTLLEWSAPKSYIAMPSNMKDARVSILMATYNGAAYLRDQLESILSQTHENLEILIQDDGSEDNTMEILQEYAMRDSRIQLGQAPRHLGINGNFFELIEKSTGDYIAISDQDDVWRPHKIECLLSVIGDASLAYTDSELIDEDGKGLNMTLLEAIAVRPKYGRCLSNLYEENSVSGHSCIFAGDIKPLVRRSVEIGIANHGMYDQLIATIASFVNGVVYHDSPLTLHRSHRDNSCNRLHCRNDVAEASRPKSSRKKKKPFMKRKKMRVLQKLAIIRRRRRRFVLFFDMVSTHAPNPFVVSKTSPKKAERKIFSLRLYQLLRRQGVDRSEAIELCSGNLLYQLLRSF